jgi:hypothetical protein
MDLYCPYDDTQLIEDEETQYPHCTVCNTTFENGYWIDWNSDKGWSSSNFYPVEYEEDEEAVREKFKKENPGAIITDFFYSEAPLGVGVEF